jgi:hypothetical protein
VGAKGLLRSDRVGSLALGRLLKHCAKALWLVFLFICVFVGAVVNFYSSKKKIKWLFYLNCSSGSETHAILAACSTEVLDCQTRTWLKKEAVKLEQQTGSFFFPLFF